MVRLPTAAASRYGWNAAAFWACGGLGLALLTWLACHGFPRTGADEVAIRQPAYMHLFTGKYAGPSYAGRAPYIDEVLAFYGSLFIMVSAALFRSFGFNQWTTFGGDIGVHLLLSGLMAYQVWRVTNKGWLGGLYWLGTTYLIEPVGRPEELGLLLGVLAVLSAGPGAVRWLLSIVFLGAAGATSPLAAILTTLVVIVRLRLELGRGRSFALRAAGILLLAPCLSAAIFLWYLHPYYAEAWLQLPHLLATGVNDSPLMLLADLNPFGVSSLAIFALICLGLTAKLLVERRRGQAAGPAWLNFSVCLLCVSLLGVILALCLGRPSYDYRWLGYLLPAISIVLVDATRWAPGAAGRWQAAFVALIAVGFALANRDIVRYAIAPLLWRSDSVTYAKALDAINRLVPESASIGGDSALWMTIRDGRPFIAIRWVHPNNWPEYVVSTSLGRSQTYVFEKASWAEKIRSEYEELPLTWAAPSPNCLTLGHWKIPVFHADSDWRFRLWKRKTGASSKGS